MTSSAGSHCSDDSIAQSLEEDVTQEGDRERIARLEVAVAWIKQEVVSPSQYCALYERSLILVTQTSGLARFNPANCIFNMDERSLVCR